MMAVDIQCIYCLQGCLHSEKKNESGTFEKLATALTIHERKTEKEKNIRET